MQVTYFACNFCGHRLDLPEGSGPPSIEYQGVKFDACNVCASEVTLAGALQALQAKSPRIALTPLAARAK